MTLASDAHTEMPSLSITVDVADSAKRKIPKAA